MPFRLIIVKACNRLQAGGDDMDTDDGDEDDSMDEGALRMTNAQFVAKCFFGIIAQRVSAGILKRPTEHPLGIKVRTACLTLAFLFRRGR